MDKNEIDRNLGEQPLSKIMSDAALKPVDVVQASTEHITFKMVNRACRGRRLTPNVQKKIRNALNTATDRTFAMNELFTY